MRFSHVYERIIILILHLSVTSVCQSGRSRKDIQPGAKNISYSSSLGRYTRQCTDTAGNGTSVD